MHNHQENPQSHTPATAHERAPLTALEEKVFDAIKCGAVKMRPKWHFILKATVLTLGCIIVFGATLFLASFVVFTLKQTGVWFTPEFGSRGWYEFFYSLPWILVLCAAVFIGLLEVLVRKYAFGYRQPIIFSLGIIILLIILGGLFVAATPFHRGFMKFAEDNKLPFAPDLYHGYGMQPFVSVHEGALVSTTTTGFIIHDRNDNILQIVITSQTRFPNGTDYIPGDLVVVLGDRSTTTIVQALGVRKIDDEYGVFVRKSRMHHFVK